ncbi:uncharacterized protein LOC126837159 [Adelges cooleyi]|uniref:uncharacterized protein LOC126837159 n=1 Tax=Adelges cooleyi TaxID=133065 RepID=UPI0021801FC2|nr:uncharacterized protein LOC126837159 [Adelges cooleyi]
MIGDQNDMTLLSSTEINTLPVAVKKDYPHPSVEPNESLQNLVSKYLEKNFNNFCYFNMLLWMIIDIHDVREGESKQITRAGYEKYVNLIANMILTIPNKLFENDQVRNKLLKLYKAIATFTHEPSISSIVNDLRSLADLDVWEESYPVRFLFSHYELGLINTHKDLVKMHKDVCFNELYHRDSSHPTVVNLILVLDIVSNTYPSTINTMMIRALRYHAFHDIETLSQENIEKLTSPHYERSAIFMKNGIENYFNIDSTSPLTVEHRAVD